MVEGVEVGLVSRGMLTNALQNDLPSPFHFSEQVISTVSRESWPVTEKSDRGHVTVVRISRQSGLDISSGIGILLFKINVEFLSGKSCTKITESMDDTRPGNSRLLANYD